jgi:hypothetical protein
MQNTTRADNQASHVYRCYADTATLPACRQPGQPCVQVLCRHSGPNALLPADNQHPSACRHTFCVHTHTPTSTPFCVQTTRSAMCAGVIQTQRPHNNTLRSVRIPVVAVVAGPTSCCGTLRGYVMLHPCAPDSSASSSNGPRGGWVIVACQLLEIATVHKPAARKARRAC